MNPLRLFPSCALGMMLLAACKQEPAAAPEALTKGTTIRLGFQPNEKSADLDAFAKELGNAVGSKVEIIVTQNYEELVTKFKAGSIDFAFFSPVNFIKAEKEAGAKVLLKKVYGQGEFYYSTLVVRADSKIKDVSSLRGKKIAFVDLQSTSGYLYPLVMFKKAGFSVKDVNGDFLGTHEAAVQAVVDGKDDAAATWGDDPRTAVGAWTKYAEKNTGAKFRVLEWSEPIPNDAFAVRSAFYQQQPDVVFKVMEGMISISDRKDPSLKAVFGADRMTTATSRHYDSVRTILDAQKESQP